MKNEQIFKVQPIGGVGEIGSNMTLVTSDSETILIDCGILFPDEDVFDINYLIPDYSKLPYIEKIIITHGHEDHIGAVTHLLDHLPEIEVVCTEFSKELIQRKFKFLNRPFPKMTIINLEDVLKIGDMDLHFIHVNHSIPETMGLLFVSNKNSFSAFYASDFKVDHESPYEKPFDFTKLKSLTKDCHKRLFFCDSTNIISSKKKTLSENQLIPDLSKIISTAESRVFITMFSSNIHRLQTICDIAKKSGKKVVLHGRAMQSYVATAKKCYLMEAADDLFLESKSVKAHSRNKLIIIVSGCQADFKSALNRIITDNDASFKLDDKDSFIFSSKAIPGNEKKIAKALNRISAKGAKLYTPDNSLIHASGHPCKDDLLEVYTQYQPTDIIPIHGETFFLERHCQFINQSFPQATSTKLTNYDQLSVSKKLEITVEKNDGHETRLIHGNKIEIHRNHIRERRKIANSGCVIFSARKDELIKYKQKFKIDLVGLPEVVFENLDQLEASVLSMLKTNKTKKITDFEEKVRIHIRQFINSLVGYKPVTYVHLV